MKAIDFANAMNNLPDELILEADPDTAGAGQGGRRTDKDKAGRAASVFSSPWFAVAAGLVVGFVAVALIVRAGRSNPGNPPIPPADSPTISSVAETDTTDGAPQTGTEPETDAQAQSIPVTVSVTPLRLTEGCTTLTAVFTAEEPGKVITVFPSFRLSRMESVDEYGRVTSLPHPIDIPLVQLTECLYGFPGSADACACVVWQVTVKNKSGLIPGVYTLTYEGAGNDEKNPSCTFTVGFANDSTDPQCLAVRRGNITVTDAETNVSLLIHQGGAQLHTPNAGVAPVLPPEQWNYDRDGKLISNNEGWNSKDRLLYGEFQALTPEEIEARFPYGYVILDIWELLDGTVLSEDSESRIFAPCLTWSGSALLTNTTAWRMEMRKLTVIDIATGQIVRTEADETGMGSFPVTLEAGDSARLTCLEGLPSGTYAVILPNTMEWYEYVEASDEWSWGCFDNAFYVIVP